MAAFSTQGQAKWVITIFRFGEIAGHILQMERLAVLRFGLGLPTHASVKEDRDSPMLGPLVDGIGQALVMRIELLGGRGEF